MVILTSNANRWREVRRFARKCLDSSKNPDRSLVIKVHGINTLN
jgi:hypothetical protein